jgi:hypothetical protein
MKARGRTPGITSSLMREPLLCVQHKVVGVPSIGEVTLAVQHMFQHGEVPVLWDVRDLDPNGDFRQFERDLRRLLARLRPDAPCTEKRAFVLTRTQRAAFEALLKQPDLQWVWAVFESPDEAMRWLRS